MEIIWVLLLRVFPKNFELIPWYFQYVLTEQGWEMGTELGDIIYACCQEWGNPEEFGPVGEVCEIEDELVEDYA